jgi:proteic killer suppression protein
LQAKQYKNYMLVTFNEDYLEDLYKKGSTKDKKHRYQPQVIRGYQKAIKYLIQAKRKEDLFPFQSLNFEALRGNKEGLFSVRANGQYRVEFTIEEKNGEPLVSICNVLELSNHYN